MNICLFSSYSVKNGIDNYIKFYLEMLKEHFDEVIFITNKRDLIKNDLVFLNEVGVSIEMVENEGYDFGMWYKILTNLNIDIYYEIAFVNDSCILFKSLDEIIAYYKESKMDFFSITDSNQIYHHLQSYFTIARGKKIITEIYNYYKHNGIIKSNDVRDIIQVYEIGLCKFLVNNGFKIGSMFKYNEYPKSSNISLMNAKDIINRGCPMIKKKLVFNTFTEAERLHLIKYNFNFRLDYTKEIMGIIYPLNININYLIDLK